jgi:hypothetical protein
VATLLLFFDGVGIGRDDAETNPFAEAGVARLAPLAGRAPDPAGAFRPLDATLGVAGLPQSATGQTTIYTGTNAAQVLGRHHPGFPGPTLWTLIEKDSLFHRMLREGRRPTFANAYGHAYFAVKRRWSVTTRMISTSGVPFRWLEEEEPRDEALPHDYTGEWLHRRGSAFGKRRTAGGAARVLSRLLDRNDLVLYEYFLTDLVGHRGEREDRVKQARRIEELVDAVVGTVDLARHRVVVISDHGNLEDGTSGSHTRNPVPLLAWGIGAAALVAAVDSLEALTPALVADSA